MPFELAGELTLLDLILAVQEFSRSEEETVATVASLLDSGRVRLRSPGSKLPSPPHGRPGPRAVRDRSSSVAASESEKRAAGRGRR